MNKHWLSMLLLLLAITACKSKRSGQAVQEAVTAAASAKQRFQSLQQNDATFAELSAQGNLKADLNGQSLSAAFNFKLQKDKQIWLSVKPMLGIEAVRVLIRPDSVFILDRINKAYLAKPFDWLSNMSQAPLSYAALQDIWMNNVGFLDGMSVSQSTDGPLEFQQSGITYKLLPAMTPVKAAKLEVQQAQQQLSVEYLQWQEMDKQWLPTQLKMAIKGKQSGVIELNFSKFAIENGQTYPFSIPGSYSQMD